MFELSVENAPAYLQARGIRAVRIRELGGGVSNIVLHVESDAGAMVLKQPLARLRVEQEWVSDRSRARREWRALELLEPLLPPGSVPRLIFADAENLIFGMAAAPAEARNWKSLLLAGQADEGVARKAGQILAGMIAATRHLGEQMGEFEDLTVFEQLRIDPYYRQIARVHPELAHACEGLMERCRRQRWALTHGDWSPKNLLVWDGQVMAIDFECMHFGDACFDAAFLTNHLLLKSFCVDGVDFAHLANEFWREVRDLEGGALEHLPGLLLARIDGKSPVEYLNEEQRRLVRGFALNLFAEPARRVAEVFERARRWR